MTALLAFALLLQSPPPVAYAAAAPAFAPPVAFAHDTCPCPHCPGCDGRCWDARSPRYPVKCCAACTCPAPEIDLRPTEGTAPAPTPTKVAPAPVVTHWTRVDSRGVTWVHQDRATLDGYVDALERSYAAPAPRAAYYVAPMLAPSYGAYGGSVAGYGSVCVGGNCSSQ